MPLPVIDATSVEVRPARREDVGEIENIDRRIAQLEGAVIPPWDAQRIHDELRSGAAVIASSGRLVAGFAISVWHPRSATIEILRLGVDPYYRRVGIGTRILRDLVRKAGSFRTTNPIRQVVCCVPESELLTLCPWFARRCFTKSQLNRGAAMVRMTCEVKP